MKIRNGFVSNSSSSSFIVAFKGKKPDPKELARQAGASEGTSAEKFMAQFYGVILKGTLVKSFKAYCAEECVDPVDIEPGDSVDKIRKLFDDGWKVVLTQASNESDNEAEQFLYASGDDFEVDTETIKIMFNGN